MPFYLCASNFNVLDSVLIIWLISLIDWSSTISVDGDVQITQHTRDPCSNELTLVHKRFGIGLWWSLGWYNQCQHCPHMEMVSTLTNFKPLILHSVLITATWTLALSDKLWEGEEREGPFSWPFTSSRQSALQLFPTVRAVRFKY